MNTEESGKHPPSDGSVATSVGPTPISHGSSARPDGSFDIIHELACNFAELDLRALVSRILQAALRVFGAQRGVLFLGIGDERGLVPALALNVKGDELPPIELISRTLLKRGRQGETLVTSDASQDPRLAEVASALDAPMRAIIFAPLVGPAGRVGAIYLDAPAAGAFAPKADRLVGVLADLSGVALENARVHGEVQKENARLRRRRPPEDTLAAMIGSTSGISALRRRAAMASLIDSPMLIVGERGTGKELLARAIHDLSIRAHHPFVAMDCSAAAEEELKGVILGRVGPAAMKSYSGEDGLLALADHGTLYLGQAESIDRQLGDEIAKMLRDGRYRQMGSRRDLRLDVRLILATSRNLREAVLDGTFSEALYNKVNTFSLRIPPLRERMTDVPELVAHFTGLYRDARRHTQTALTPEAIRVLENEAWPGNVEELERVIHRAMATARKDVVPAARVRRCLLPSEEHDALRYGPWTGRVLPLTTWEREAIRQALTHTRGNRSEAARLLGVHRNTLVRKVREHALE